MSIPAANSHLHQNPKLIHFYDTSPNTYVSSRLVHKLKHNQSHTPNFFSKILKQGNRNKKLEKDTKENQANEILTLTQN